MYNVEILLTKFEEYVFKYILHKLYSKVNNFLYAIC